MRNYTSKTKRLVLSTSSSEVPLFLLEINHSGLSQPIRVVNDTQDLTSNGFLFVALPFRVSLPEDLDKNQPIATLSVDNIGRELTQWLEASNGGEGATCRMMQVLRSVPNTIEWEITMDLRNLSVNITEVTGELSFEDLLGRPGVTITYRPDIAPGLF